MEQVDLEKKDPRNSPRDAYIRLCYSEQFNEGIREGVILSGQDIENVIQVLSSSDLNKDSIQYCYMALTMPPPIKNKLTPAQKWVLFKRLLTYAGEVGSGEDRPQAQKYLLGGLSEIFSSKSVSEEQKKKFRKELETTLPTYQNALIHEVYSFYFDKYQKATTK